ncbi:MAG: hypothetical protein F2651_01995 [Actinobacteria bacterium]|nr:hypothetical protein [Actinomycetota bacterium]MSV70973.1 hypothetical protein [Actinomycetota bacterium]MSW13604.1 hypothetical protein [Actinomycetota bacterium]MSX47148.1 hypothetical protein [Actinomycetota bacterium]MSX90708.1 hypothetical protein [Actinomycetota bacterium]
MKRLLAAVLISLITVLTPSLTNAAGVIDEQYSADNQTDNRNKIGVLFEENVDTLRMPSMLFSYELVSGASPNVISYCEGLNDPVCANAEFLKYYALMPPCETPSEVDCIESVYAVAPGSPARIKGIYKESIPEKVINSYKADPINGLPQGSVSGVWEIPNVQHGGGSTNFVGIVSRVGSLKRSGTNWVAQPPGSDPWGNGDFRASIYPVNVIRDSRYKANISRIIKQPNGATWMGIDHPSQLPFDVCAAIGDGVCALRQTFPENIKFGMVFRFSRVINGWLHGRIDSPEIDYELTSYGTRVDMKGLSTRVPIVAGWVDPSSFTAQEKPRIDWIPMGVKDYPGASGDYSMQVLNMWSRVLKDTAAANPTQWIFYNLSERDIEASSSCIKNSKTLAGFVTTNSTTYTATPPIYNEQTGTLDYKVASPHFLADGKVFQGKYNLYIDSKVARCIYKFSNAPISASVSITSSDGGQQSVATTVVSEKNGWLNLSAAGFTFSSPTLKVKLTQDASAVAVTPTPSATPSASAEPAPQASIAPVAKKSTITCIKGKLTKKVTAASPKCPTGYKKKA